MMRGLLEETIAAIATPPGQGAIAVIRVSGPGALAAADRVFSGRVRLSGAAGYTVHHGYCLDAGGERVDEVLATVFRAPRSYTGEDVAEISCHGGMLVTRRVLEALLAAGARHAHPGEFTRRAFLNGRMDLSQAEAVMSLISAQSAAAGRASLTQLEGRLGERVKELRQGLLRLCALLELELDFAEEGLQVLEPPETLRSLEDLAGAVRGLAASYTSGRLLREGVGVVFAGKPNAGKSSLFNAVLKESRAIVTPHPGTTRDLIEEVVVLEGIPFRLHDTAGLREAEGAAEQEGVRRTLGAVSGADLVVMVVDPFEPPGRGELEQFLSRLSPEQKLLWVVNKADLGSSAWSPPPSDTAEGGLPQSQTVLKVSARTGEGIGALEDALIRASCGQQAATESLTVTSRRQADALQDALASLEKARKSLEAGYSNEFIALDLREGANRLAEITGEISSEEVLNAIFEQFCIGK